MPDHHSSTESNQDDESLEEEATPPTIRETVSEFTLPHWGQYVVLSGTLFSYTVYSVMTGAPRLVSISGLMSTAIVGLLASIAIATGESPFKNKTAKQLSYGLVVVLTFYLTLLFGLRML